MNKIVNRFLLNGDTVMPYLHLRQSGFTNRECRPFTKHCDQIQNFKEKQVIQCISIKWIR